MEIGEISNRQEKIFLDVAISCNGMYVFSKTRKISISKNMKTGKKDVHSVQFLLKQLMPDILVVMLFLGQDQEKIKSLILNNFFINNVKHYLNIKN